MRHLQSIFLILILFTGSFTQAVTYAKHWFGHGPYSEISKLFRGCSCL